MFKASAGIATSTPPLSGILADVSWPRRVKVRDSMDGVLLCLASPFRRDVIKIVLVAIGSASSTFEVDNDLNLCDTKDIQ